MLCSSSPRQIQPLTEQTKGAGIAGALFTAVGTRGLAFLVGIKISTGRKRARGATGTTSTP